MLFRSLRISLRDASSLDDSEVSQLLKTVAKESKKRIDRKNKELVAKNAEEFEFFSRCRALVQIVVPGPLEVDTDRPLERAYQLFQTMVSTVQTWMQETKEE